MQPRLGLPSRRATWVPGLPAILAAAISALQAQVLFIDQAKVASGGPALDWSTASSLQLTVTVLRYSSKAPRPPPTAEDLQRCKTVPDVVAALRSEAIPKEKEAKAAKKAKKTTGALVETLYHASRDMALLPGGQASFTARETRPVFCVVDDPSQGLTNRQYGLSLQVDAQRVPIETMPGAPPVQRVRLVWDGSFVWSQALLAGWERIALALYKTASKIPGITYESQTEDEDGFVETGSGVNLGGLFKRKKEKAAGTAAAAASDGAANPSEPSYQEDAARQEIPMRGERLFADREMVVFAFRGDRSEREPEAIYLVLQPTFLSR